MLVVSRKMGETVVLVIPPSQNERYVEVTVCDRGTDIDPRVRVGVEAEKDVLIMRGEIVDRVCDKQGGKR